MLRSYIQYTPASVLLIRKVHATIAQRSRNGGFEGIQTRTFSLLTLKTFSRSSNHSLLLDTKVTITVNCIFHPGRAFHTEAGGKVKKKRNENERRESP
jgi:hypothetical protein